MHRIRLKNPWTVGLHEESGAVVYGRKFHKPTGTEEQSIALQVALLPQSPEGLPQSLEGPTTVLAVLVNGRELTAQDEAANHPKGRVLRFQLTDLADFNLLEIRVSIATGITGPIQKFDTTPIPTFGSFVIESVELQIE